MDTQRATLYDATLREIGDGRPVLWLHHDPTRPQRLRERTGAISNQCRLLRRLGDVHGDGQLFVARECGDRFVQRGADRVRRVWRDAQDKLRSCKTAKWANGDFQIGHACGTLCRIGTEDLLIHDPAPTELVERAY